MKAVCVVCLAGLLALASCGDDESANTAPAEPKTTKTEAAGQKKEEEATGTRIILAGSEFGSMLYGADKQAIYIFQRDPKGKSACYGECATAWPPVYTKGEPRAGKGVKASLLGTTKRRDGRLQVTYAGQPLYFYDHEGPGEVRCHNVNLNGGLWWVVGR